MLETNQLDFHQEGQFLTDNRRPIPQCTALQNAVLNSPEAVKVVGTKRETKGTKMAARFSLH